MLINCHQDTPKTKPGELAPIAPQKMDTQHIYKTWNHTHFVWEKGHKRKKAKKEGYRGLSCLGFLQQTLWRDTHKCQGWFSRPVPQMVLGKNGFRPVGTRCSFGAQGTEWEASKARREKLKTLPFVHSQDGLQWQMNKASIHSILKWGIMEITHYSLYLLIMIQNVLRARGQSNSTHDSGGRYISGWDFAA